MLINILCNRFCNHKEREVLISIYYTQRRFQLIFKQMMVAN